jgi:hypothetical protein
MKKMLFIFYKKNKKKIEAVNVIPCIIEYLESKVYSSVARCCRRKNKF